MGSTFFQNFNAPWWLVVHHVSTDLGHEPLDFEADKALVHRRRVPRRGDPLELQRRALPRRRLHVGQQAREVSTELY